MVLIAAVSLVIVKKIGESTVAATMKHKRPHGTVSETPRHGTSLTRSEDPDHIQRKDATRGIPALSKMRRRIQKPRQSDSESEETEL